MTNVSFVPMGMEQQGSKNVVTFRHLRHRHRQDDGMRTTAAGATTTTAVLRIPCQKLISDLVNGRKGIDSPALYLLAVNIYDIEKPMILASVRLLLKHGANGTSSHVLRRLTQYLLVRPFLGYVSEKYNYRTYGGSWSIMENLTYDLQKDIHEKALSFLGLLVTSACGNAAADDDTVTADTTTITAVASTKRTTKDKKRGMTTVLRLLVENLHKEDIPRQIPFLLSFAGNNISKQYYYNGKPKGKKRRDILRSGIPSKRIFIGSVKMQKGSLPSVSLNKTRGATAMQQLQPKRRKVGRSSIILFTIFTMTTRM